MPRQSIPHMMPYKELGEYINIIVGSEKKDS